MEFPISSIGFYVPRWTEMLKKDHPLKWNYFKWPEM